MNLDKYIVQLPDEYGTDYIEADKVRELIEEAKKDMLEKIIDQIISTTQSHPWNDEGHDSVGIDKREKYLSEKGG